METNLAAVIARTNSIKKREAKHNPGAHIEVADKIGMLLQQQLSAHNNRAARTVIVQKRKAKQPKENVAPKKKSKKTE